MATSCKAKRETYFQEPDLIAFFSKGSQGIKQVEFNQEEERGIASATFSVVVPIMFGCQLEQKKPKSMCSHIIFVISKECWW